MKYRAILGENLQEDAKNLRLGKRFNFPQDHNPKHTDRTAELNPTENLWQDLRMDVNKCYSSSMTELEVFCKTVKSFDVRSWNRSTPKYLRDLIA